MAQDLSILISQIDAIQSGHGHGLPGKMHELAEPPCLATCEKLVGMGIATIFSTGNKKDIGNHASIAIKADTLSVVNDARIRQVLKSDTRIEESKSGFWGHIFTVKIPIPHDMTAGEISKQFLQILDAINFQRQPAFLYAPLPFEKAQGLLTQKGKSCDTIADMEMLLWKNYDPKKDAFISFEPELNEYYEKTKQNAEPGNSKQVTSGGRAVN